MTDWYAHVTVATVIEEAGRFLLVEERADGALVLNQPAGHVEPGESLVEAALRETLEETGWRVEISGLVGLALYTAANGITYHRTTFAGRAVEHFPGQDLDSDIERVLWMSRDEMRQQAERMRSPLVVEAVEQYLRGPLVPLEFIYHS